MNKNAYIISGALAVLLIIAGFVAFGGPKNAVPTTTTEVAMPTATVNIGVSEGSRSAQGEVKKAAATVTYSNTGFSPNMISIGVGDTVLWVNDGDKQMWVASNPHPSHTDYPEFDELKSVGKGESYSFTFTKPGTWKYHNHSVPGDRGTIEVK